MAFKRIIRLDVGFNKGTNLRLSDLDMSFEIKRSFKIENNTAKFIIYNAKAQTRNKVLVKDNNITFQAGYEDEGNIGTIFSGIILTSDSRRVDTEWITEIMATDFGANTGNLLKETISVNYGKATAAAVIITDIKNALSVPIAGLSNLTFSLSGGYSYSGSIRGIIKEMSDILKTNDIGLYFDNSEMVLYRLGQQNSEFGVLRITGNSGLIGPIEKIKDQNYSDNKERLKFKVLLNPAVKPNKIINLSTKDYSGIYITEEVLFAGDNFGGDFFSELEVVE